MFIHDVKNPAKPPLKFDGSSALWLARMCVGEGDKGGNRVDPNKVRWLCWAIVNRWFLWPGSRHYSTFVKMMRRFSQPINPRWMFGGDLAKKYAGRPPASPKRLERRARICALQWTDIHPETVRDVLYFVRGGRGTPDSVDLYGTEKEGMRPSNWASLASTPIKHPDGFDVGGDWFFEDSNLAKGEVIWMSSNMK